MSIRNFKIFFINAIVLEGICAAGAQEPDKASDMTRPVISLSGCLVDTQEHVRAYNDAASFCPSSPRRSIKDSRYLFCAGAKCYDLNKTGAELAKKTLSESDLRPMMVMIKGSIDYCDIKPGTSQLMVRQIIRVDRISNISCPVDDLGR